MCVFGSSRRKVKSGSLFRTVDPFSAFTLSACQLNPTSRGSVELASADPRAKPLIDPNYLATELDQHVTVKAFRHMHRILRQVHCTVDCTVYRRLYSVP